MDKEDAIEVNTRGTKEIFERGVGFLRQKKIINVLAIIALIAIIIFSSAIRTTNIPDLKDVTTGEYTLGPDLDPFLYLRVAHEIIDYGKPLNPDYMRYHGITPYYNFVPYAIAYLYKFFSLFSGFSLEYVAIIFPVIFFSGSIILFFFFVRKIFERKSAIQKNLIAVFSTALYAFTPLMLHRTVAGIPELESAGLFFFWLSFLFILYALEEREENFKISLKKRCLFGLLSGISTSFMIFTWGGVKFIFMAISISILIAFFLGKVKKEETLVYASWFLPSIVFLIIKTGVKVLFEITTFLPAFFVFLVLITNLFIKKSFEEKIKSIIKKDWVSKEIISLFLVILIGCLMFLILNPSDLLNLLSGIKDSFIYPFGKQRVSLTVAENSQPYVVEWMSNFGKDFFWLFFLGTIFLFNNAITQLTKKEKIILNSSFVIFMFGFIFSRYSPSSILNGENMISQFIYFGSLFLLFFSCLNIYLKRYKNNASNDLSKIDFSHILILSLIILMIIASRGAVRLFVISSPIFIIAAGFLPVELLNYGIKAKDNLLKIILFISLAISLFFLISTGITYEKSSAESAKYSIPSAYNIQWQKAMEWVRENTLKNDIFVHWWDYGYWIQTLGERPTVTDGGHEITYWDHLVGRYLLTTPYPETALSFMKTNNVSYLLIDSTDLGKYGAYSIIGSNKDGQDRYSQIPIMIFDPSQSKETNTSSLRIYRGGSYIDEDIIYGKNEDQIFLPANNAMILGVVLEIPKNEGKIKQPMGIFVYNQKQMSIPIRYVYYEGKLLDFEEGLDSVVRIVPKVTQDPAGLSVNIDRVGTVIYLSPKVSKGLFSQLYLLNDPLNKYGTIKLAYLESDPFIKSLNDQGANLGEFAYLNEFRGPIKIWNVKYPDNIIEREEFLRTSGDWAEFDNLTFVR